MVLDHLNLADLAGALVGFTVTLFILSYLFSDNALFRLAVHVFIAAAAGIAAAVAWGQVLWPMLLKPLIQTPAEPGNLMMGAVPLILCILLLGSVSPRLSAWSRPALAFLVGVGAATAVGGAVLGTILPQVRAAISSTINPQVPGPGSDLWLTYGSGFAMLISTISVLVYFQFWRAPVDSSKDGQISWLAGLGWIGKLCIAVTLGLVFAGIYLSALAALVDRIEYLTVFFNAIIHP